MISPIDGASFNICLNAAEICQLFGFIDPVPVFISNVGDCDGRMTLNAWWSFLVQNAE